MEQLNTAEIKQDNHQSGEEGNYPLSDLRAFVDDVRAHLIQWRKSGKNLALLTLVNVEGSSPRPIGSQMLVSQTGESVGLLSGGCVESALVSEAQACIERDQWRMIRYGKASDYFDIQLPCGSGIDVLIVPILHEPHVAHTWLVELEHALERRVPVQLEMDVIQQVCRVHALASSEGQREYRKSLQLTRFEAEKTLTSFQRSYNPKHRVVVVGQGAVFDYFLKMAESFDTELVAYSNQFYQSLEKDIYSGNQCFKPLKSAKSFDHDLLDAYSSLVILSHDHQWDVPVLTQALSSDVSYISALGSQATHQQRLTLLTEAGVSVENRARVKGPAGLNIGGQTPPEIALSIWAELISKKTGPEKNNLDKT
ncbi:XdhC family protein [Litoribacillus peritrichatus]|uniref:XdhC family protein n=1 Tax=Litoribacillus peritrichatus TaxID=718191 RepID=A0ABP7N6E7_9GAMM